MARGLEKVFSFWSQRRAMPKNVQTIMQLCSFHVLIRLCSKSFKLAFSSIWTEKFEMYRLDLEKAEEPEIKSSAFIGSWRKQGNTRKISTSASPTTSKPLTVDHNKLWKILKERGILGLTCPLTAISTEVYTCTHPSNGPSIHTPTCGAKLPSFLTRIFAIAHWSPVPIVAFHWSIFTL